MCLDEIADALPDYPIVAGESFRGLLEIAQELSARASDVLPLVGNHVVPQIRMPLAESANYQAAVGCSDIKPWQHLPPTVLEHRLYIARMPGDVCRVNTDDAVLRDGLEEWLRPGYRRAETGCNHRKQSHQIAKIRPADQPLAQSGVRRIAARRMTAR